MAKEKKAVYRMIPNLIEHYPTCVTQVKGSRCSLTGKELTVEVQGDNQQPPKKITVPAATQEQLKYLLEVEKHPFIELVEIEE